MMIEDPEIDMAEFAENIRFRINEETIVTASIGYSRYEDGLTTEQLIKNADRAMYAAKKTGKNRVIAYTDIRSMETTEDRIQLSVPKDLPRRFKVELMDGSISEASYNPETSSILVTTVEGGYRTIEWSEIATYEQQGQWKSVNEAGKGA